MRKHDILSLPFYSNINKRAFTGLWILV